MHISILELNENWGCRLMFRMIIRYFNRLLHFGIDGKLKVQIYFCYLSINKHIMYSTTNILGVDWTGSFITWYTIYKLHWA